MPYALCTVNGAIPSHPNRSTAGKSPRSILDSAHSTDDGYSWGPKWPSFIVDFICWIWPGEAGETTAIIDDADVDAIISAKNSAVSSPEGYDDPSIGEGSPEPLGGPGIVGVAVTDGSDGEEGVYGRGSELVVELAQMHKNEEGERAHQRLNNVTV